MTQTAFHASRIFDGHDWHEDAALLVSDGRVDAIVPASDAPKGHSVEGWLVPGFVDLQVNGGGGVLFNNEPSVEGIAKICRAHLSLGTTSVMVTLITDNPDVTSTAIVAAGNAVEMPGFLGLHLEGPHLALSRKGTHDPSLIRVMTDDDLVKLTNAAKLLPHMICTVATESVTPAQISTLAAAGVTVSLGHTDCTSADARAAFEAGARMVTHLYNAMSQLAHRQPGLVGAALDDGRVWPGLIADGFHVDDAALRVALRGKAGPARIFLVSDAMSTIGTDLPGFTLNGRQIYRRDGRLTLADGTLAGADIAQIDAVRYVHETLGLSLEEALRLAGLYPAQALAVDDLGHLKPGAHANFLALTPDISASGVWLAGRKC